MNDRSIAYFSIEMALRPGTPSYRGGFGVLAGDTIRSAAGRGHGVALAGLLDAEMTSAKTSQPATQEMKLQHVVR